MSTPEFDQVWPDVTAIVPTHNRPEMMREAVGSVLRQDYPGRIETVIVFDKAEPDMSLTSSDPDRPVRVIANTRTPGLAGARNSGIVSASGGIVAFLDDDDTWKPDKLRRQVSAFRAEHGAEFCSTAMEIVYDSRRITRLAHRSRVSHQELLRSRLAMLHSSSFIADRSALIDGIGMVDETIPRSMAEDWDLLLRASRRRDVVHLDEPLVNVRWGPTSYFADQWQARNDARIWMLEHHPEIAQDGQAAGLAYGKLAFGEAMLGRRRESVRWVGRALRADWKQKRTPLALLVALCPASGQWIVNALNQRGHGI